MEEVEFLINNFETYKTIDPKLAAFLHEKDEKKSNPYRYMFMDGESSESEEEVINTAIEEGEEEEYVPSSPAKISGTIRYDLSLANFNLQGGIVKFINGIGNLLSIASKQVKINSVTEGSTIVNFDLLPEEGSTPTTANQQLRNYINLLDKAVQNGNVNFYGAPILEYSRDVYLDTSAPSESDDGSGPGLAIGLVVGLVSFTVIIVVVFVYQRKNAKRLARERLTKHHDLSNQI